MNRWPLILSGLLLAGCAGGLRDTGPSIGDLQRHGATDEAEALVVDQTPPVAASPELALENYRRLLELQPDAATQAEARRRMADLHLALDDLDPEGQDLRRLDTAIELYRQLLREQPGDPGHDRVLYPLARALQARGETEAAIDTLAVLAERFPHSSYAADGRFRRAELLYAAGRYREALPDYQAVRAQPQRSSFHDAAGYKYAWTLYQLGRHAQVIDAVAAMLDGELAAPAVADLDLALAEVPAARRDLVRDMLRLVSLAFTELGGTTALGDWQQASPPPAFLPLYHLALAEAQRDDDDLAAAAATLAEFSERQPYHPLAPAFRWQAIELARQSGDAEAVLAGLRRYAADYALGAPHWQGRSPSAVQREQLHESLSTLARHHHARAQQAADGPGAARQDYQQAARDYTALLALRGDAPDATDIALLRAEALYGAEDWPAAADAYEQVAYGDPQHAGSPEAAYAAVLVRHRIADDGGPRRDAVESALRFIDAFARHPQHQAVLMRSVEDLYALGDMPAAVDRAGQLLATEPPADATLRHRARTLRADAAFSLARYAEAESDYLILAPQPVDDDETRRLRDQAALAILRQGEAADAAADPAGAVAQWLRIGRQVPEAGLRADAEYRAALRLIEQDDWAAALPVLEGFASRYPDHAQLADVDKRLAIAYVNTDQPAAAATTYARIALRSSESVEVRREAAWQAATLFDTVDDPSAARRYAAYLADYRPEPVEATRARQRLIELHRGGDGTQLRHWLADAVAAGDSGYEPARLLAARASLELGRMAAADSGRIRLRQPLARSLGQRRDALQRAVDALARADDYGYAEISTAALHARGRLYQELARDLLDSERPAGLDELAQEEYQFLLEEHAFPFEEQAIRFHEQNLQRIRQGLYDDAIRRSHQALLAIAPGRYEKAPLLETFHDRLH